jgi:hypothetical protein
MKGSCEYIEKVVAHNRQGVALQLKSLAMGLTISHLKK